MDQIVSVLYVIKWAYLYYIVKSKSIVLLIIVLLGAEQVQTGRLAVPKIDTTHREINTEAEQVQTGTLAVPKIDTTQHAPE